jgi:O-antigen/teichoic acid export membrane protein
MLDAEAPIDQQRGSFLGHVNVVMFTYAVDGVLAFASGVLVARALGADGRGAYSLFLISTALGQMVLGAGFGNAAIYFINKRELSVRQVVSAAHVVTLAALAVTALAVGAVAAADADLLRGGVPAWLLVPAVPVLIYAAALRVVLQAESRFVEMGVVTIAPAAVMLALVAAAYAAGHPTPARVVGFWIVANGVGALLALSRLGLSSVDVAQIVRPRLDTIGRLARFGVQGEAGNILQLMNYRLDQYIVRGFVGLAGVGVYAVGVSVTEGVWLIANSVAIVLLPRLTSAAAEDVRWMAPVAARNTVLVAGAAAVVLAVLAPLVVPAFFGSDFQDSVQALWWLLPGTVALTGSKVLTSYNFSQGRPLVNTGITLVSLVVTVIALFALVPRFGVNGAAAASSLAYGAHFAAALFAYGRISGEPVLEALVPRPSDARLYLDGARGVLSRLARRPAAASG